MQVLLPTIYCWQIWWWQEKADITSNTTHKVSRHRAMTSVENCVITARSPSTMLPMNGCRTWVRSVDERCEQYSDTALTAEIRTHGGCEGFTPATVACRNLQKVWTCIGSSNLQRIHTSNYMNTQTHTHTLNSCFSVFLDILRLLCNLKYLYPQRCSVRRREGICIADYALSTPCTEDSPG